MLGLVTDAALVGPRAGTVAKAGEAALWELAAAITALQLFLQGLGAALEHRISRNAQGVLDAEEFAELIEQRQSETGVTAQLDLHAGKSSFQTRHQTKQQGHDAAVTGSIARAQAHREQAPGVVLEDQHGVIHVLAVAAVKEAELLLAMRGIIGGINIE